MLEKCDLNKLTFEVSETIIKNKIDKKNYISTMAFRVSS